MSQPGGVQSVISTIITDKKNTYSLLTGSTKEFEKKYYKGIPNYGTSCFVKKCKTIEIERILEKVFQEFQPEIIYTHNLSYMFNEKKAKAIFEFFNSKNVVLVEHTHHAYIKRKKMIKKILNLKWDKIITISNFANKRISKIVKDKQNVVRVPNSINLKQFKKIDETKRRAFAKKMGVPQENIFLFPSRTIRLSTGAIGKQKQFLTVLKALKLLKKTGFGKFVLVIPYLDTNEKNKEAIKKFNNTLEKFNLKNNLFIYPKKLTQNGMIKFYSLGNIILFPSIEENFGMVAVESLALRIPIIICNSGGTIEIIKNNETGLVIPPENPKALAQAIKKLSENKELYSNISKNQLRESKKYSSKKMISLIQKIFESIPKKEREIILVRHGQTEFNEKKIYSGQLETILTKKGISQAKKIRKFFFNKKHYKVYCSPLKRAKTTAEIIFGNKQKMIFDDKLKEINTGVFSGKTKEQIEEEFPFLRKKTDYRKYYPGGENFSQLRKRVKLFLKKLPKNENIVIVGHETTNKMIASILTKTRVEKIPRQLNNQIFVVKIKNLKIIEF